MEINKVTFESIKTAEITQSFDDLDINKDGVISEADATATTDTEISSAINDLLSSVDEEGEIQETSDDTAVNTTENTDASSESKSSSSLTDEEKAELESLNTELESLTNEINALNEEISSLQSKNEELLAQKAALKEEQATAQEAADIANAKLEEEQAKLDSYSTEYDNYQKEIEELNSEILLEQGREEEAYNDSMTSLVNKTINDYDPTTDGDDFDAYFAKKMNDAGFPVFTKLDELNSDAQKLSDSAASVLSNIKMQSSIVSLAKRAAQAANDTLSATTTKLNNVTTEINSNNTQIDSLKSTLEVKETRKTEVENRISELNPTEGTTITGGEENLSASELLALISDEEKELAKQYVTDLSKCVIAKAMDGKWHIYESGDNWAQEGVDGYYMSIARKYGCGTGWSKGTDIVPWVSGELSLSTSSRFQKYSSENGGTILSGGIYSLKSVNDCWTDGEVCCQKCCYDTDSPLSFDVDGDGINTTNETVSFDIDGDGDLDTVNNSAEWVLAFDKDKDGIAGEDGSELFGNNTDLDGDGKADGYKDGFEALKALAKKEGLIGENDTKLDEADIKLLSEKYGLVMTKGYAGEAKSLSDIGITEINLATTDETTLTKNFDGKNNDIMTQEGATFVVNGETHEYADIWNAKKDPSEAVTPDNTTEKQETVIAKLANTDVKLGLNKEGVVALKGNVDFKNIKNSSMNKAEAPANILDEVVEVKEEENEI